MQFNSRKGERKMSYDNELTKDHVGFLTGGGRKKRKYLNQLADAKYNLRDPFLKKKLLKIFNKKMRPFARSSVYRVERTITKEG